MDLTSALILAGLGAFHGLNPAMGWLFAVALGLQEHSRNGVLRALPPIVLGHAASVLVTLGLVSAASLAAPPKVISYGVAALVCGFGVWRLVRRRHPRWVGMKVTQVAAGRMVVPDGHRPRRRPDGAPGRPAQRARGRTRRHTRARRALASQSLLATGIHTLAMLATITVLALLVYERLGVAVLRKAWFNLDFAWAVALIGAGAFAAFT